MCQKLLLSNELFIEPSHTHIPFYSIVTGQQIHFSPPDPKRVILHI